jgi:prepilin-type processing-associated H-X9-DG protein
MAIPDTGGSTAVVRDVKRAVLTVDFPPEPRGKIVLDTAPGTAAKVKETLDAWLKTLDRPEVKSKLVGLDPAVAAELLSPKVTGDRLTIELDAAALKKLIGPLYSNSLIKARAQSLAVRSMSNMRQILMGTIMFANENKGAMPDSFAQLGKYGIKGPVLVNPRGGKATPDYIYIKPADKVTGVKNPADVVMLYENPDDLAPGTEGINVGYADGHVEMHPVKDFNERIKPKLPAAKPE